MAYYQIFKTKKGKLKGRIYISNKDIETGKTKNYTKRIHNEDNLTESKFKKLLERETVLFEEEVRKAVKEKNINKIRILTFPEIMAEWKVTVQRNLSHNYLLRIEDVEKKFKDYLISRGLYNQPISEITIRDIQLFLNSFMGFQEILLPFFTLKRDICKFIPIREIKRNTILQKCSQYNKKDITITRKSAESICNKYGLNFDDYFKPCVKTIQYSLTTIKGYRRILRTVFNEALRYDWIPKNPVCFTKVTSTGNNGELIPVTEKEVFSMEEAKDFLNSLNNEKDKNINKVIPIKIMLLAGLRSGEIHGLRWSDINFEKKTLKVVRARQYSPKIGCYEKTPKTKTSIREIPLPDYLIEELEDYKNWFRLAVDDFDENMNQYYIASNIYREPSHPEALGDWLKRFEHRTNQKEVTCHGLRHTYCSILLSKNVPIQTVSRYMGHSDSTVTLKVYSHFLPDTQNFAINALNDLIN